MDKSEKWFALTVLQMHEGKVVGKVQLIKHDNGAISQMLNSICICFAEMCFHDSQTNSKILAFYEMSSSTEERKIIITEYESSSNEHCKFKQAIFLPTTENAAIDLPVYMQISSQYAILYVVMKSGRYLVYEIRSSNLIGQGTLSDSVVFLGVKDTRTDGVLVLNRKGILIELGIDQEKAISLSF